MTDTLRDRIAAVIRDHPQGQEWGIPDEECTQCPPLRGIDWAQHVADAVIEALGIYEDEWGNRGVPVAPEWSATGRSNDEVQ